jgi:hypothetical protein
MNSTAMSGAEEYVADLSTAEEQRKGLELLPPDFTVEVQMTIEPGGAGSDGWLKKSQEGDSTGLNVRYHVLSGAYEGRIIFDWLTIAGTTPGQQEAVGIAARKLRAIKESAFNVVPDPTKTKPEWLAIMRLKSYGEFHGLCFVGKTVVTKESVDKKGRKWPPKNSLATIITPDMQGYYKVPPRTIPPPDHPAHAAADPTKPIGGAGAAAAPAGPAGPAMPVPAIAAVAKPSWATST